jgi:hypothetical protein
VACPFKFNHAFLKDESFGELVQSVWRAPHLCSVAGAQRRLVQKLINLKNHTKSWLCTKEIKDNRAMAVLVEELEILTKQSWESGLSPNQGARLKKLELDRNSYLMEEEARWRLKSRAIWIKNGDKNTKYFHHYASFRRNKKHLWEIMDDRGQSHQGQEAIKSEALHFFRSFYQESTDNRIVEQIEAVRQYPRLVMEEEVHVLERSVTKEEVLDVLKGFMKDKSPGPDGWTVEFYLHFYDLVAQDLVEAVEEARITGEVNKGMNTTFIALIPKVNGPATFGDFRPIALCNLCYKIITKIIAKRIRPILSRTLSEEQFGFLKGRQIGDAIGTAQECLHSIKEKKLKALILKIDLKKAYDCISWDFLRLVLLQCGFGQMMTNWIMGSVTSASYAVLINGEPTDFFSSGRGLRQGCPLSPLLFILIMEGLSLALKKSKREGLLTGIKVSRFIRILHLFFVDDILILTNDSLSEWKEINRVLNHFCLLRVYR